MRLKRWCFLTVAALFAGLTAGMAAPEAQPEGTTAGPTRTVEVTGAAVINSADVPNARKLAIQQALREAVERTVGVYVSSTLQTRNYVALEDRVYTRASGFAVLDEVLQEWRDGSTYHVKIRATVKLKPLVAELNAAELTRPWRVVVAVPATAATYYEYLRTVEITAEAEMQRQLRDAGFQIVDWRQAEAAGETATFQPENAGPTRLAAWARKLGADVILCGQITTEVRPGMSLPADWTGVEYSRCKALATVRAIRADTAEVIAVEMLTEDADGTSRANALRTALGRVGRRLGNRLTDDLLLLPGALCRTLQVTVYGFTGAADAWRFEQALAQAPGMRQVRRQRYSGSTLTLDITIAAEAADRLAVLLEEYPLFFEFKIHVESDSKRGIIARVASTP